MKEDASLRDDTSQLANVEEKKRREKIKSLQLFVRILVNGRLLRRPDGLTAYNVMLKPINKDFDFSMQVLTTSHLFEDFCHLRMTLVVVNVLESFDCC